MNLAIKKTIRQLAEEWFLHSSLCFKANIDINDVYNRLIHAAHIAFLLTFTEQLVFIIFSFFFPLSFSTSTRLMLQITVINIENVHYKYIFFTFSFLLLFN